MPFSVNFTTSLQLDNGHLLFLYTSAGNWPVAVIACATLEVMLTSDKAETKPMSFDNRFDFPEFGVGDTETQDERSLARQQELSQDHNRRVVRSQAPESLMSLGMAPFQTGNGGGISEFNDELSQQEASAEFQPPPRTDTFDFLTETLGYQTATVNQGDLGFGLDEGNNSGMFATHHQQPQSVAFVEPQSTTTTGAPIAFLNPSVAVLGSEPHFGAPSQLPDILSSRSPYDSNGASPYVSPQLQSIDEGGPESQLDDLVDLEHMTLGINLGHDGAIAPNLVGATSVGVNIIGVSSPSGGSTASNDSSAFVSSNGATVYTGPDNMLAAPVGRTGRSRSVSDSDLRGPPPSSTLRQAASTTRSERASYLKVEELPSQRRSRSTSATNRNRNRSRSRSSNSREYILELASPSDPMKRVQKHPSAFACPRCDKKFTRVYNLRSHLRTHTDERPFVCSVCGRAFARQHDRKRHEALHSGEKKYECSGVLSDGVTPWGCGRKFARADALGRHFRTEAGRVCIRPLLEEEAADRAKKSNVPIYVGADDTTPSLMISPPETSTTPRQSDADAGSNVLFGQNFLPTVLLQQYPSLGNLPLGDNGADDDL